MTVSNQTNRTSVVGDDTTQEIPFSFPASATSDIEVRSRVIATGVESDPLTENSDYTVSLSDDTGGTVTMITTFDSTYQIHVKRNTPMTQTLDLVQGGSFNAENIEDALDKNTKLSIENADSLDRTLRFPETDADSIMEELPKASTRAGKFLYFGASDGNPSVAESITTGETIITPFGEELIDDDNASAALTTLGFSPYGKTLIDDDDASAVLDTLGFTPFGKSLIDDISALVARGTLGIDTDDNVEFAKVISTDLITKSPWFDLRAFLSSGFVTDGSVDYATEIQAAIDAAAAVNGTVLFPPGTWGFDTGLVIQDESVVLKGAGAVHKWNAGTSATTLLYGGAGDAITLNNVAGAMGGVVLRDFELRDETPGTANDGIVFTTAGTSISNIVIDTVQITDFGGHGIYSSGTVFEVTLNRVGTKDCLDDSIKVELGGGTPSQWKFYDCWLTSTAGKWCANLYMNLSYFFGGTIAGRYTGHGVKVGGMCELHGLNIEGVNGASTIGLQYVAGSMCIVEGCLVYNWGTGLKIGEGAAATRGFEFRGHVAGGNDDYDVHLVDGGARDRCKVFQVGYAGGVIFPVILNERESEDSVYYELQVETMKTNVMSTLANDGTPTVAGRNLFETGGTTTITDFDDGIAGQIITVLCKHSLTFDFTTAQDADHNLDGSSANITADSGDILKFFCEDSLTWNLMSNLDASVDNN